jgi:primase-polymerase (primpol)-like protein
MGGGLNCRTCGAELSWRSRADAVYCSSKCRVAAHRNPIPKEMRDLTRWVRYSKSKIPLTPDNDCASATDRRTWSDFDIVQESNAGVGIGFVFNGDGIIGIDLDKAFDFDGKIKTWAQEIIDSLPPTYVEVSPSGNGIHIIGRGIVLGGRRWKFEDGCIEIYGTSRYFTVTGKRFKNSPLKLGNIGHVIDVIEPLARGNQIMN